MIVNLQSNIGTSMDYTVNKLISAPIYLLTMEPLFIVMIFMYLLTDSLIAFKSAFLNCFGLYILNMYKIITKDPRPFWISAEITSYDNCYFNFSSPSTATYLLVFYWSHNIIMHRMKFTTSVNNVSNHTLYNHVHNLGLGCRHRSH